MADRARNLGLIMMGLNRAQQRLTLSINQVLAAEKLTLTRLVVLSRFSNQPNRSRSVGDLVALTGLNQPTVTKSVAFLIEQGWLENRADPKDARKKVLTITADGLGTVIRAYGSITPLLNESFSGFDDEQIIQLFESVNILNETLKN